MSKMPVVNIERDIGLFLDKVEAEAFKLADIYKLPHALGDLLKKSTPELVGEKVGPNSYRVPVGIYQIILILPYIIYARGHLRNKNSMELAHYIGSIIQTMHLSDSPVVTGEKGGRQNKGITRPFTRFLDMAISYTSRSLGIPKDDVPTDDIIYNLEPISNDLANFPDEYIGKVEIKNINVDDKGGIVDYSVEGKEKYITMKRLRERISTLKSK